MYYNNSTEIKARIKRRSRINRAVAIILWVIAYTMSFVYVFTISGRLSNMLAFMAIPVMVAVLSICSAALYYYAYEYVKKSNKLRAGSRMLFMMSLAMFIPIVVLWGKYQIFNTSLAWVALMITAPISIALIIGFLSFLVASKKLKAKAK